jgi:hypothetical protein
MAQVGLRRITSAIAEVTANSAAVRSCIADRDGSSPARCPVTGRPCQGDLAYLCEDYGCARKAGLSPH